MAVDNVAVVIFALIELLWTDSERRAMAIETNCAISVCVVAVIVAIGLGDGDLADAIVAEVESDAVAAYSNYCLHKRKLVSGWLCC